MSNPEDQLELFKAFLEAEQVDESPEWWVLDRADVRLYRLRWERGIEVVNVAGGRL